MISKENILELTDNIFGTLLDKYNNSGTPKYLNILLPEEFCFEDIHWDGKTYNYDEVYKWYKTWSEPLRMKHGFIDLWIDIESGKVLNLDSNHSNIDFYHAKIVDSGTYSLYDKDYNIIHTYRGYVPKCLQINENGFGDYIEMTISDCYVKNWSWNEDFKNEIMNTFGR